MFAKSARRTAGCTARMPKYRPAQFAGIRWSLKRRSLVRFKWCRLGATELFAANELACLRRTPGAIRRREIYLKKPLQPQRNRRQCQRISRVFIPTSRECRLPGSPTAQDARPVHCMIAVQN